MFNPIHFTVVAVFVVGVLYERPVVRIQSSEVDEILWTGANVSFRKEEVKVFPQLVEGCYTYQQSVDFAIGSVCTFFSVFLRFPRTPLTLEFGVVRSALLYTHPQTLDILSDIIHRRLLYLACNRDREDSIFIAAFAIIQSTGAVCLCGVWCVVCGVWCVGC